MTLYTRKILAQWQWHFTKKNIGTVTVTLYSKKYWHSDSDTLLKKILAQWQWHFTQKKYWHSDSDTSLKKNIGTVTVTLYSKKYWHSDSDTLLKKNIGRVTVTLHSRASIHFRPHFPRLLVDSGDHRYTDSPRDTIHETSVLRSRCHERHTWLKAQNRILPRFLHVLPDSYKIRCNADVRENLRNDREVSWKSAQ